MGNVLGVRKGNGNGPRIVLAGHTDTVFPMETDLTLKQDGNRYSCPGIGDDTRAVAELLSIARAMNAVGIRGEGDIVFCANVCEEGLGDLRGTKYVFGVDGDALHQYDGFVSIDDKNTAGIIYLYPTSFLPEVNEMSKQIPIVNIGDKNDEITFDSIHISSVKPARLVAEHLISLGHRKITYISTPITDIERSRSKRYDALVATFKEHGFGDDCVQIRSLSPGEYNLLSPNLLEYSSGYNLTKQILEEGTDCTAFVGYNDMVAFGILDALYEMKYKVPNDFSVCGFDNVPMADMNRISLTTVEHSIEAKGREAVDIIVRILSLIHI